MAVDPVAEERPARADKKGELGIDQAADFVVERPFPLPLTSRDHARATSLSSCA